MKSIRSRVANISEFLREPISVDELRERILERIFGTRDPRAHPVARARRVRLERRARAASSDVRHWAWNYGENPPCNVQRVQRFAAGEIDVRLDVQSGASPASASSATSWAASDVGELEARIRGLIYERATHRGRRSAIVDISRLLRRR